MSTASLSLDSRNLAGRTTSRIAGAIARYCSRAAFDLRQYAFRDTWRVVGSVEEVAELFVRSATPSDWWPQLSGLGVDDRGADDGSQRAFRSRVRGFLPYELDLDFRVVEVEFPRRFAVELRGDLQGRGDGTLRQEGRETVITFEATIRAVRPLIQFLSFLVRPILRAQHRWVMRRGEQGLDRALMLRRGM